MTYLFDRKLQFLDSPCLISLYVCFSFSSGLGFCFVYYASISYCFQSAIWQYFYFFFGGGGGCLILSNLVISHKVSCVSILKYFTKRTIWVNVKMELNLRK